MTAGVLSNLDAAKQVLFFNRSLSRINLQDNLASKFVDMCGIVCFLHIFCFFSLTRFAGHTEDIKATQLLKQLKSQVEKVLPKENIHYVIC